MSEKMPGQQLFELCMKQMALLAEWKDMPEYIQNEYHERANIVRQPLIARIAELESELKSLKECECGRPLSCGKCNVCDRDVF